MSSAARRIRSCLLLALAVWTACADEGATVSTVADNGGMSGTGVSQGTIDSFGSIYVNDVRWDLSEASIDIDDASSTESDLRVGMVVRVVGSRDDAAETGVADEVRFDTAVAGPLADDPLEVEIGREETFVVLGRTVTIRDRETVFDGGAAIGSLGRDDVVRVSGFAGPDGSISATWVELLGRFPRIDAVETEGLVQNLIRGTAGGSFELGDLLVRFDEETTIVGTLADGDRVEVTGTLNAAATEIDARRIALVVTGLGVTDADDVELEGIVTGFESLARFFVEGVPVDASSASIEPSEAALVDGVEVELEGRLVAGTLVAEEVEVEDADEDDADDEDDVELRGELQGVDPVARTLTVLGVEVEVLPSTHFEDDTEASRNFGFGDLTVGDWLEIDGVREGSGRVFAEWVERIEADDSVELRGPVTALDPSRPALEVLGIPIPIPIHAESSYIDGAGRPRSAAEFFGPPARLGVGSIVRVVDAAASDPTQIVEVDLVEVEER